MVLGLLTCFNPLVHFENDPVIWTTHVPSLLTNPRHRRLSQSLSLRLNPIWNVHCRYSVCVPSHNEQIRQHFSYQNCCWYIYNYSCTYITPGMLLINLRFVFEPIRCSLSFISPPKNFQLDLRDIYFLIITVKHSQKFELLFPDDCVNWIYL